MFSNFSEEFESAPDFGQLTLTFGSTYYFYSSPLEEDLESSRTSLTEV